MTDKELVVIIKTGNPKDVNIAFKKLYGKYINKLTYFICGKLRDKNLAPDLAQESFVKAFRFIEQYEQTYAFSTWLYAIARNIIIDYLRSKHNKMNYVSLDNNTNEDENTEESVTKELCDLEPTPYEKLVNDERKRAVNLAIDKGVTNPITKQILKGVYLKEDKFEEMAHKLNLPMGTIKVHTFRGKARMKKFIEKNKLLGD
jgi:RNA polymerase sigma-70 factor, ECF subfamily